MSESRNAGTSYRWDESYAWNYDHVPQIPATSAGLPDRAAVSGQWDFCGIPVESPLGVAAGPLLNGRWCLYYAALGFDVLTYKTVRSRRHPCYPMPNLQPVDADWLDGTQSTVRPTDTMNGSWAVSFGMPSADPEIWRQDVRHTRNQLPERTVLSVSVVGTVQPGWSLEDLAADYALCAKWAVESGADVVEANLSCPNVATCDGQLYHDAEQSRIVASAIRQAIGDVPLVLKIGHVRDSASATQLVQSVNEFADALAMTNSIAARVGQGEQPPMFDGQLRGICGAAIRDASIRQVQRFAHAIDQTSADLKIIGVGGIESADHVQAYLAAGAHACHLATAVMTDPHVALRIRSQMATQDHSV